MSSEPQPAAVPVVAHQPAAKPAFQPRPLPPPARPIRPVSDIKPPAPVKPQQASPLAAAPQPASPISQPGRRRPWRLGLWRQAAAAALTAASQRQYRLYAAWGAALGALGYALLVQWSHSLVLNHTLTPGLAALGVLTLIWLALGAGLATYGTAAIAYGTSKTLDHRPTARTNWYHAGVSSFWRLVSLNLVCGIMLAALAVLAAILTHDARLNHLSPWLQVASLGLVGLIAVYLAVGIFISRIMGRYAIVLGELGVLDAFGLGWQVFSQAKKEWGVPALLYLAINFSVIAVAVIGITALNLTSVRLHLTGVPSLVAQGAVAYFVLSTLSVYSVCLWLDVYRQTMVDLANARWLSAIKPRPPLGRHILASTLVILALTAIGVASFAYRQQLAFLANNLLPQLSFRFGSG